MIIRDYSQYILVNACCPCVPDSSPQPSLSADSKDADRSICGFKYQPWATHAPWEALSSCEPNNAYFKANLETLTQSRTNPTSAYSITYDRKWRLNPTTAFCSISTTILSSGDSTISNVGFTLTITKTQTEQSFTRTIVGTLTSETEPTETFNETHTMLYTEKITDYEAHLYDVVSTYIGTLSTYDGFSPISKLEYTNYTSCTGVDESHPTEVIGKVSKYRIGIPDTNEYMNYDAAYDLWVIDHAAWELLPPEEQGLEPLEPIEAKYYKAKWDEYFFPKDWEDWRDQTADYNYAVILHDEWDDLTPEEQETIPEPEVPDPPGAEPTKPNLLASRSFVWTGGDKWSPYYEMALPEIEGESRVVNLLGYHYRSARFGAVGTLWGESYWPIV